MADAATLDVVDDIGEPPEGKLAPAAVINKDDAHDETDEDDNTLPTREEANRGRRKLERERRLTERPQPGAQPLIVVFAHVLIPATHAVCHIPPRRPFRQLVRPLTFRGNLSNSSLESTIYCPTSTCKFKDQLAMFTIAYPQPNTLNSHEIYTDLQIISSHRTPAMFIQRPVHPLDVGMGVPPAVVGSYGVSTPPIGRRCVTASPTDP